MTEEEANLSIKKLYWLTAALGMLGFIAAFSYAGPRHALAFAGGALGSLGNLWVFERLGLALAPGPRRRKPLEAGAYIVRTIVLLGIGYAIVSILGANAFAVILGLLTSAAAVLASLMVELVLSLFRTRRTQ